MSRRKTPAAVLAASFQDLQSMQDYTRLVRIHIGKVRYHGVFAKVSDGEYLGCAVAIKRLKMKGDSDRIFKVLAIGLAHPRH